MDIMPVGPVLSIASEFHYFIEALHEKKGFLNINNMLLFCCLDLPEDLHFPKTCEQMLNTIFFLSASVILRKKQEISCHTCKITGFIYSVVTLL